MKRLYLALFLVCGCVAVVAVAYTVKLKTDYLALQSQLVENGPDAKPELKNVCVQTGSPPSLTCVVKSLETPNDAEGERGRLTQEEIANWTFGMLIVGIVGAMSGLLGLFWIRESLVAAKRANEISREAFVTGERPWIFTDVTFEGDVEIDEHDNWSLWIFLNNTNYGKTVGLRVHSSVTSCPMGKEVAVLKELCARSSHSFPDSGVLIAPGKDFRRRWNWGYHPGDWKDKLAPNEFVARMIVGCVTYETPFGEGIHQTGFVYIVQQTENGVELLKWSGGFAN